VELSAKPLGKLKWVFKTSSTALTMYLHDRNRRVVSAHLFALNRVIFAQEIFIKMNDRIFGIIFDQDSPKLKMLVDDIFNIANAKNLAELIDNDAQTFFKTRPGNVIKKLA
jgi:hypothetical protein